MLGGARLLLLTASRSWERLLHNSGCATPLALHRLLRRARERKFLDFARGELSKQAQLKAEEGENQQKSGSGGETSPRRANLEHAAERRSLKVGA